MQDWIYQRWENRDKRRYYECRLQPNLFGSWEIIRNWGGIGKATGNKVNIPVSSYQDGLCKLEEIKKTRRRKKYETVKHYGVM